MAALNPDDLRAFRHDVEELLLSHQTYADQRTGRTNGITIYSTQSNLQLLSQCQIAAADATFDVSFKGG